MDHTTDKRRSDAWVDEQPESGYKNQVRAAIDEGRSQIAAGKGIPADQVWKELGIE
jgi:hypothetical protein